MIKGDDDWKAPGFPISILVMGIALPPIRGEGAPGVEYVTLS